MDQQLEQDLRNILAAAERSTLTWQEHVAVKDGLNRIKQVLMAMNQKPAETVPPKI